MRQLRLRDIGGIIVIDFIDMANPKNRATVEEALRTELERDRTKTYVVEISPLGLVEMTRQNVTDGPREILTKKCPTCAGDGIVVSEASAALEVERRLRTLAAGSRAQAFRVEVSPQTASLLARARRHAARRDRGGGEEALLPRARRRASTPTTPRVLAEGKLVDLQPEAPVAEGAEVEVKLVEVDKHDAGSAVGKLDGLDVVVGGAAKLVGKKAKVRIERVLDGVAYADAAERRGEARRTDHVRERGGEADARAEPGQEGRRDRAPRRPTRSSRPSATIEANRAEPDVGEVEIDDEPEGEPEEAIDAEPALDADGAPAKKKTRRGSRGGRNRKKKPAGTPPPRAQTPKTGSERPQEHRDASETETEPPRRRPGSMFPTSSSAATGEAGRANVRLPSPSGARCGGR